ncbi:protein translocase subunit SecD [Ferrimonas balearica]|uniref:protein translocase subunit SecD n=1 Tax=Ferrimonas balearica TaxID=44012 RepID=UPI001F382B45|nr:protein translocase subunit SecD [Ferrimonas balearica]MBY6094895.1 protein translocase subunit SecD [Ferrimonas balearica]
MMKKPTRASAVINRYPAWKYVVLVVTLVGMTLSALPSWYGEDAAIDIHWSHAKDAQSTERYLESQGISVKAINQQGDQTQIVLADPNSQFTAQAALTKWIGTDDSLALSQQPAAPSWLLEMGFGPMSLGLDLRGGVQFLLDVDMAPVMNAQQQAVMQSLRSTVRGVRAQAQHDHTVTTGALTDAQRQQVIEVVKKDYPGWQWRSHVDGLSLSMKPEEQEQLTRLTVIQNLQILRSRIEELGITEAVVQRQGTNRIRIELPGVQDPVAAKKVIGATTSLAFYEVNQGEPVQGKTLPFNQGGTVSVKRLPVLTGEHIIDARAGLDEMSQPQVNIVLDAAGGRIMSDFTRNKIGYPMATAFSEYRQDAAGRSVVDTEVISVATIQSQLGSRFVITGSGSMAEAQQLALLLRAGSLTAPVVIVEERTIGPTLGAENIENGFQALAVGMGATLLFMALWYRRLGWVANVALVANLVTLFGLMALLPGAVLTLPGIAGLVLTVGMAVDTNVLIFERIRDMIRQGHSLARAIHLGFDRALTTIWDANLTTMITALVLYSIGNGPIQGFALTLGLGLMTSLFTGVFLSRALINLVWGQDTRRKVTI